MSEETGFRCDRCKQVTQTLQAGMKPNTEVCPACWMAEHVQIVFVGGR